MEVFWNYLSRRSASAHAGTFTVMFISGALGAATYYYIFQPVSHNKQHKKSAQSIDLPKHPLLLEHPAYCGSIYMDYNATTPVYTEVYEAIIPYLTVNFGNPSSSHIFGPVCKQAVETARLQVGRLLRAANPVEEIIFTSCGTESDNRAIDIALHHFKSLCADNASIIPEVVTTRMEHPAVLCYLRHLKLVEKRIEIRIVSVSAEGIVSIQELEKALSRNTCLVTVMHSNNEVGTVQPIRAISHVIANFNRLHKTQVLFHTDACQSVGKIPVDVNFLGVDLLTLVGHKFGAPKGIGALYVKKGLALPPLLIGGGQEHGLRSGTENVAYAAGLGVAAALAESELLTNIMHFLTLKQRLLHKLCEHLSDHLSFMQVNGPQRCCHPQRLSEDIKILKLLFQPLQPKRHSQSSRPMDNGFSSTIAEVMEQLPNTLSISFRGLVGHEIVSQLGNKVACSAGSACHTVILNDENDTPDVTPRESSSHRSGKKKAVQHKHTYHLSEVLEAMGVSEDFGLGTIRLSVGRYSSIEQMDIVAHHVASTVKAMYSIPSRKT